jgi:ubiquinone/menaquinone biosynthesis C-methylase UbiE
VDRWPVPLAQAAHSRPGRVTMLALSEVPEYRPFPNARSRNWRQARIEVPALVCSLRLPEASRVLEVGCGRGVALAALARLRQPRRLVGVDIDGGAVAEARRALDADRIDAEVCVADVRALPFEDGAFDVVIDFGTLFHIAHADLGVAEIARVLALGGQVVHETKVSQLLSHPVRARGRQLPWEVEPRLRAQRWAGLWATRIRVDG